MQLRPLQTFASWLVITGAIAVIYLALARLGFLVALEPGHVTVLWPASGFAVAAVILVGRREALAGVWLGAFLANVWVNVEGNHAQGLVGVAAIIALGALAQAALAAWALQRWAGYPEAAAGWRGLPLRRLLRLAGLAALLCLTSATLGTTTLWLAGVLPASAYAANWGIWWLGDWLGVVVVTPLTTSLGKRMLMHPLTRGSVLVTLDIGLVVAALLFGVLWLMEAQRIDLEFAGDAQTAVLGVNQALDNSLHDVEMIQAYTAAANRTSARMFTGVSRPHLAGANATPGLWSVMWAAVITATERLTVEAALRMEGAPLPQFTEWQPAGAPRPAGERPVYVVVRYGQPPAVGLFPLGYDLATDPAWAPLLTRARDDNQVVAQTFTETAASEQDYLILWPVYQPGARVETPADRQAGLRGYALGLFHLAEVLSGALLTPELKDLDVYLFDVTVPGAEHLLQFRAAAQGSAGPGQTLASLQAGLFLAVPLAFADRRWEIVVKPTARYSESRRTVVPWIGLLIGLGMTVGIAVYFAQRMRFEQRLEQSQADLNYAQTVARLGSWRLDLLTRQLTWSAETYRLLGLPPGQPPRLTDLLDRVHSEDRAQVQAAWTAFEAGPAAELEFRVRAADGVRWLRQRVEAQPGAPASFIGTFQDVTAQKQSEAELRANQSLLQTVIDSTPDWIFIKDHQHRYQLVNQAYAAALELQPDQVLGQDDLAVGFSEAAVKGDPAAGTPGFWAEDEAVWESGRTKVIPLEPARLRGRDMYLQTIKVPLRDAAGAVWGVLGFVHDITERVHAETALRESEARYRRLVESAPVIVYEYSTRQGGRFYSPGVQAVFGLTPEQLLAQPKLWHDAIHPDDMERVEAAVAAFQAGGSFDLEYRVRGADGQWRWLHDQSIGRLTPAGETLIEGLAIDITDRKLREVETRELNQRLERRVDERTEALSRANAELTRALRAKDEFLANMSHELRTPLNGILAFAEALTEGIYGPVAASQAGPLDNITASGRHLLGLINDILDISKIEANQLRLQWDAVEVSALCQACLQVVRPLAARKSLRLLFESTDMLAEMRADARRLRQILVNLLGNAVKFTPAGGEVKLSVATDAERQLIQFTVRDTGPGIAPADQTRIFQPFTQVDGSLTRQYEGTGLGLALVSRLTELHGGSVSVVSRGVPGEGSCFSVTLPWRTDPEAAAPGRHEPSPAGAVAPAAALPAAVILLAEDNEQNIQALNDFLQFSGYRVVVARNGQEALERAEETAPDAILMDIQMPVLDGLSAIRELRARPQFAATPIVALTALAMPGDREQCLAAGADEYLSKPVSLQTLGELLRRRLARSPV